MTPYDQIEQRLQNGTELSELTQVLYILLNGDFAVWEDGSLYSIRRGVPGTVYLIIAPGRILVEFWGHNTYLFERGVLSYN